MTEEQISKVEQELLDKYITAPLSLEQQIKDTATQAARNLVFGDGTAVFSFGDDNFVAKGKVVLKDSTREIVVAISNEQHREAAGNSYLPFSLCCELDNNFTLLENYKAVFEVFLRHITDTTLPEVLDDDE